MATGVRESVCVSIIVAGRTLRAGEGMVSYAFGCFLLHNPPAPRGGDWVVSGKKLIMARFFVLLFSLFFSFRQVLLQPLPNKISHVGTLI